MSMAETQMSDLPPQIRAFIALPLDPAVARELDRFQRRLEDAVPQNSVRWATPEQLHLTLKFLGNIPAQAVEELTAVLRPIGERYPPLQLRAEGMGCFPSARRPRVIWVGLHGDLPDLARLQEQVEGVSGRWAEKEERRPFSPHLTLGRVRETAARQAPRIGEVLQSISAPVCGSWTAPEFLLMRSQLSPHGATHTVLARFPLARAANSPAS